MYTRVKIDNIGLPYLQNSRKLHIRYCMSKWVLLYCNVVYTNLDKVNGVKFFSRKILKTRGVPKVGGPLPKFIQ